MIFSAYFPVVNVMHC